jgi:hypothetical protein
MFATEGWGYKSDVKDDVDETLQKVQNGEIRISDLPEDQRMESLVIHIETREGTSKMHYHEIFTEDGKRSLGEDQWDNDTVAQGRCVGFFKDPDPVMTQLEKELQEMTGGNGDAKDA